MRAGGAGPDARRRALLRGVAGLAIAAGGPARADLPPLRVLASFSILADLVEQVAGPAATVDALVGRAGDVHAFEPSPSDARRLREADVLVLNGLGFEPWLDRLAHAAGFRGLRVTASAGVVPLMRGSVPDPHAWHALAAVQRYVRNVAHALAPLRPAHASAIAARAEGYGAALVALEREARERLAPVPPDDRRVIVAHDAFGYLGAEHEIAFSAPARWGHDTDLSAADLARLVRQVRAQQVRALFGTRRSDERLIRQIARETGVPVGGTLHADALTAPGGGADTFLTLYRHNLTTLADALRALVRPDLAHRRAT